MSAPRSGPLLGRVLELNIGAVAAGGACVARHDSRVGFVRHALPGEQVVARVTEDRGGAYFFADAVQIIQASPDRVPAPCPHAGPGRCGGCDWQHASGAAQRKLKAQVIRDQFRKLAGLDVSDLLSEVAELPGGLLGWRSRNMYAVDADGRLGLRRHRSHEVERIGRCWIGAPGVGDAPVLAARWPGLTGVEVARGDDENTAVLGRRPGSGQHPRGRRPPDRVELIAGPETLRHRLFGRDFAVSAAGFWQGHPAAAETFATAVLEALRPAPGERVLDLYAGAGALTAVLADAVGRSGSVLGVEADRQAAADAAKNLADLPHAQVRRGRVTAAALRSAGHTSRGGVDLVVLDPPRAGAGREVMTAILGLRPRAVGYVACDPAALARDVATARDAGWRLSALSAFDAFPMTAHVECVAALDPPG